MPLYEYYCEQHGTFEKLMHGMSNNPTPCPKCGRMSRHLISTQNHNYGFRLTDRSLNQIGGPRDEYERDI